MVVPRMCMTIPSFISQVSSASLFVGLGAPPVRCFFRPLASNRVLSFLLYITQFHPSAISFGILGVSSVSFILDTIEVVLSDDIYAKVLSFVKSEARVV